MTLFSSFSAKRLAGAAALITAIVALLPACATTSTGRRQLLLISETKETALGTQAFNEMKAKEKSCANAAARAIVGVVGRRIAAVSPQPKWPWTFELFDAATTMNAFALPGGKVGIYSGLFDPAGSAAGLAAVMGHEVAHAILRHGSERMSQGIVVQMGVDAAGVALGDNAQKNTILAGLGLGAQVGVMLPYSRDMESEADSVGLLYMAAAGYDPREAVAFWQRFKKATGGSKTPSLLSTHPATETRIAALQAALPKALELYGRSAKLGLGAKLSTPRCDEQTMPGASAPAASAPTPASTPPAGSGRSGGSNRPD